MRGDIALLEHSLQNRRAAAARTRGFPSEILFPRRAPPHRCNRPCTPPARHAAGRRLAP